MTYSLCLSPAMHAALCALRGESDIRAVHAALLKSDLACLVALAPDVHPDIRMLAALASKRIGLVEPSMIADAQRHDVVRRIIGTDIGNEALWTWAEAAAPGWGRDSAKDLVSAVRGGLCSPAAAAALIGPTEEAVVLLDDPQDIAFAIQRWGRQDPNDPSSWFTKASHAMQDVLIGVLSRVCASPEAYVACLPWLPPAVDMQIPPTSRVMLDEVFASFACASEASLVQHRPLLESLIQIVLRSRQSSIEGLTRLALAFGLESAWHAIHAVLDREPHLAMHVVTSAPWDAIPQEIRNAILSSAERSSMCDVISVARGVQEERPPPTLSYNFIAAFFSALNPTVWRSFSAPVRREWLAAMRPGHVACAIRSLGVHPDILARAQGVSQSMIAAVRMHAADESTVRQTLFPVALQQIAPYDACAVMMTLAHLPPDPISFLRVTCRRSDGDGVSHPVSSALQTPADLAAAVALQHAVSDSQMAPLTQRCAALEQTLHGRRMDEIVPLLDTVSADVRTVVSPDISAFTESIVVHDHDAALRCVLDRIAALPPSAAFPAFVALSHRVRRPSEWDVHHAGVFARTLHQYGDIFLAFVDALPDDERRAFLPIPQETAVLDAFRALAEFDPFVAWRLGYAVSAKQWDMLARALRDAPPAHASAVWHALHPSTRQECFAALAQHIAPLADEGCAATLVEQCRHLADHSIVSVAAIAGLSSDDPEDRVQSIACLAKDAFPIRSVQSLLRDDVRAFLFASSALSVAIADIASERRSNRRQFVMRRLGCR